MPSLDDAARDYGGISLEDESVVVVHLLLYGMDLDAPSMSEAREWEEHYGLDDRENHVVLVGDSRLVSDASYSMIPGLHLVDRNFVLRYDAAGRRAPHDMWTDLLPGMASVIAEL
jgi:hypothetical protein